MMASSKICLKRKFNLTKDQNSSILLLSGILFIFSIIFFYLGLEQLYKLNTLFISNCKIKSIDLKSLRNNYVPRWNVTLTSNNQTNTHILLGPYGTKSDKWAWIKANKYQINKTYPCYRSISNKSILQWGWQWEKPNQLNIFIYLTSASLLFLITILILLLKRFYFQIIPNLKENSNDIQLKLLGPVEQHEQENNSL